MDFWFFMFWVLEVAFLSGPVGGVAVGDEAEGAFAMGGD
jgi:hypothetical protein